MLKVVSFKICPFVQRVTGLLEAKGVPYEIEYISLKDKPGWFLEVSPNGQVPLLLTESGQALFESDAIAEYLDDITMPLEVDITPEQRAMDRAWSYMAAKHYLVQCSAMRSADQNTLEERAAKLRKAFHKAEWQLGDGPYFKGEQLSNVDIAWLPLLHRAFIVKQRSGYDFLDGLPKVQAWQQALMDTGLSQKSVSDDFVEQFSDFYLSSETYLGCGQSCSDSRDKACGTGSCC